MRKRIMWIIDKIAKLKCHGIENWKQISINLFIQMIVAIVSIVVVLWIFNKETDRNRLIERKTYDRNFAMILSETSENLAKLTHMRNIKKETLVFCELSDYVARNTIANPLTYKYTGEEFMYLLRSYLLGLDTVKSQITLFSDAHLKGVNVDDLVPEINKNIEKMIYLSYLLEYQTQYYINLYCVGWPLKLPNHNFIIDQLKNMPNETEKICEKEEALRSQLTEMAKMPKDEREKQHKALIKALEIYERR